MSTFRGVVQEFPDIQIDYFRPTPGLRPPRGCFLSHVHSDHLVGLDSTNFNTCFIYCSAATREILLRLEKYPQRLNFQQGIQEKPPKVTYKHLDKLLKTIPLEAPTLIELESGNVIQVTLFDANHCTGAVMFLIEGNKKAILYTGDIRSEPWFVNNLTRNPFLIEYTCGLKRLDCIYLDTSNTVDIPFPTKADGLKELLQKVSKYPVDTVFHFTAWTFGYEEVWMALSRALSSQIHVDEYKMRLYASLRGKPKDSKDPTNSTHFSGPFLAREGPALTGYTCGNNPQPGCLTSNPNANVRIHSCARELRCDKLNDKVVWIRPIITRTNHGEMAEVGVGGGVDDLVQRLEIELDSLDAIDEFLELFSNTKDLIKLDIRRMLCEGLRSNRTALSLNYMGLDPKEGNFSLTTITEALARYVGEKRSALLSQSLTQKAQSEPFPRVITFPYSRHSSYAELCHLVEAFDPRDVYPCTVDEANWDEEVSMENLFGGVCSAVKFRHDDEMRELHAERQMHCDTQHTQTTATSDLSSEVPQASSPVQRIARQSPKSPVLPTAQAYKITRRNSQGQTRLPNGDGNEIVALAKGMRKESADTVSKTQSTPPQDIIAVSPGSASQNLRRKAIHEGLEGQVKRARLSFDDPVSSSQSAVDSTITTPVKKRILSDATEACGKSDDADVPTPNSDANGSLRSAKNSIGSNVASSSASQCSDQDELQVASDPYVREFAETCGVELAATVLDYDEKDKITTVRCRKCGYEMWTIWMTQIGICTHCDDENPPIFPYYEIIDDEAGPRPGIEPGEMARILRGSDRKNIVGDYLDDHSDAYDSVDDEEQGCRSEYDSADSFVDDASIDESQPGRKSGDSSSESKNTCYGALFEEFQPKYRRLVNRLEDMVGDSVSGDENASDGADLYDPVIEGIDEYGAAAVDLVAPKPAISELVLSLAQQQSQESELSGDRIWDRVEAFEAAAGENWNQISMVSTGDNHTNAETEL